MTTSGFRQAMVDGGHVRGTVSELGHDRAVCVECGTTWPCEEHVKSVCERLDLAHGLPCNCGWHEEKDAQDLEQEKAEVPAGIVGYTPEPKTWTVRRCAIHEIVATDEEFCPVLIDADGCGLQLSEPFKVARA